MAGKEDCEPYHCECGGAEIIDVVKEIKPGGETYLVFRIRSTCDVARELLTDILSKIMGDEPVSIIDKESDNQISPTLFFR